MTRCPFADWRPISENITRGGRKPLRGFVPHVQTNDGDLFGFFNTRKPPGEGGSADFQCFKDGRLQQFVDLVDQSWAQGSKQHNGNPDFMSCEFEGSTDEPMTDAQIDQGGRLMAWSITDVNPWPLQLNLDPDHGQGVTPHHVFGGGHTCPGPGPREGQFPDLIDAANRWLAGPPHPLEDPMSANCTVGGIFHAFGLKDGDVYATSYDGGWTPFKVVGHFDGAHGLAASASGERIDLTLVDGTGAMRHCYKPGKKSDWAGWDAVPGSYD